MDKHLLKIRKSIIGSMITVVLLLTALFIISLTTNIAIDFKKIITFGLLLPLLLFIILGIAYFGNKFKAIQQNFMTANDDLIKGILGKDVFYQPKGHIPFNTIGIDPSVSAKQANSCRCNHVLTGKYRGFEFIATNLQTFQSTGYSTIDHSIFNGYYILLNTNSKQVSPLYLCDNDFWEEFNVKGPLQFTVNQVKIHEIDLSTSYKLVASEIPDLHSEYTKSFEHIFQKNNLPLSLNFYPSGKIGMAIRSYNAFIFSEGPQQKMALDDNTVRKIISQDANEIKKYLDQLVGIPR